MTRVLPRALALLLLLSLCFPVSGAAQLWSYDTNFSNPDLTAMGWVDLSTTAATWTVVTDPAGIHGNVLSGTGFSFSEHGVLGHSLGFPVHLADGGLWSWGTAFYIPADTDYSFVLQLGNGPAEDVLACFVIMKGGAGGDRVMFIAEDKDDAGNNVEVDLGLPALVTQHWYHLKLEQVGAGAVEILITDMETWLPVFQNSVPITAAAFSGMSYIGVGVETVNAHYFDEIFCEYYEDPTATQPTTWGKVKSLY